MVSLSWPIPVQRNAHWKPAQSHRGDLARQSDLGMRTGDDCAELRVVAFDDKEVETKESDFPRECLWMGRCGFEVQKGAASGRVSRGGMN